MQFTYNSYSRLLNTLQSCKYVNRTYTDWRDGERCCILRHDIDYDLRCALPIAEIECNHSVRSTYFVLLTTNFYNLLSADNQAILHEIANMGHSIGLHFDEMNYPAIAGNKEKIVKKILWEIDILQQLLGSPVDAVSMHRPSKEILAADLDIPGVINSYSNVFFREFKYVSDSRRRWREPVMDIVESSVNEKLHILTHPFWYNTEEVSLSKSLKEFILSAEKDRYDILDNNFTDLESALLP